MDEIGLTGFSFSAEESVWIRTHDDGEYITFTVGSGFKKWVTDPAITDNGKSVGERNIEDLHQLLDGWIKMNRGEA